MHRHFLSMGISFQLDFHMFDPLTSAAALPRHTMFVFDPTLAMQFAGALILLMGLVFDDHHLC